MSLVMLTIITILATEAMKTSNMEIQMAHAHQEGFGTAFAEAENGLANGRWELAGDFTGIKAAYDANGGSYFGGSDDTAHSWYDYEMTYFDECLSGRASVLLPRIRGSEHQCRSVAASCR